jgi:AhpD family alkylhydroperoxidase
MPHRIDPNSVEPAAAMAIEQVYAFIRQAELDTGLLDLVALRVSQINGCAPCIDRHSRDLVNRGIPLAKLFHVPFWADAGLFDDRERAALAWVEIVTGFTDSDMSQGAHETARARFSEDELTELTTAIGLMNLSNRLAISFGTAAMEAGSDIGVRGRD